MSNGVLGYWGSPSAAIWTDAYVRVYAVNDRAKICEWASDNNGQSWSGPNCNMNGNGGFNARYNTTLSAITQKINNVVNIQVFFQDPYGGAYSLSSTLGGPWRLGGLP